MNIANISGSSFIFLFTVSTEEQNLLFTIRRYLYLQSTPLSSIFCPMLLQNGCQKWLIAFTQACDLERRRRLTPSLSDLPLKVPQTEETAWLLMISEQTQNSYVLWNEQKCWKCRKLHSQSVAWLVGSHFSVPILSFKPRSGDFLTGV